VPLLIINEIAVHQRPAAPERWYRPFDSAGPRLSMKPRSSTIGPA